MMKGMLRSIVADSLDGGEGSEVESATHLVAAGVDGDAEEVVEEALLFLLWKASRKARCFPRRHGSGVSLKGHP